MAGRRCHWQVSGKAIIDSQGIFPRRVTGCYGANARRRAGRHRANHQVTPWPLRDDSQRRVYFHRIPQHLIQLPASAEGSIHHWSTAFSLQPNEEPIGSWGDCVGCVKNHWIDVLTPLCLICVYNWVIPVFIKKYIFSFSWVGSALLSPPSQSISVTARIDRIERLTEQFWRSEKKKKNSESHIDLILQKCYPVLRYDTGCGGKFLFLSYSLLSIYLLHCMLFFIMNVFF